MLKEPLFVYLVLCLVLATASLSVLKIFFQCSMHVLNAKIIGTGCTGNIISTSLCSLYQAMYLILQGATDSIKNSFAVIWSSKRIYIHTVRGASTSLYQGSMLFHCTCASEMRACIVRVKTKMRNLVLWQVLRHVSIIGDMWLWLR